MKTDFRLQGQPASLRFLTWNVHGFVGADRKRNVERTAHCVARIAPDIAAFQEIDTFSLEAGGRPTIASSIQKSVGTYKQEAWALSDEKRHYGQVVLSRFPLRECKVHDISVVSREPRRAIDVQADTPHGPVRIIATHLGLRRVERRFQIKRICELVSLDTCVPTVLLGDLNEWSFDIKTRKVLHSHFDQRATPKTFPSKFPILKLDRIYARGGLRMRSSEAMPSAALASDHLPVFADILHQSVDAP